MMRCRAPLLPRLHVTAMLSPHSGSIQRRWLCKAATTAKGDPAGAKQEPLSFGKQVGGTEDSAAQKLHDVSRGKYAYLNDFSASLNTGPVKLQFTDEPKSDKEIAQEKALAMMQRSMLLGSLLAVGGVFIGWQITKRYMGVSNARVRSTLGPSHPQPVSQSHTNLGRNLAKP